MSRSVRRARRAGLPETEERSLNIYPLMDVMTILLVFLVMQLATTASALPSDELDLPFSTSERALGEALAVQVTRTAIVVDGEPVVRLRDGRVDPSDKPLGGQGFLVAPLHRALAAHRDRLRTIERVRPDRPFDGELQILADRTTPYRTLAELVYSAGQAEFRSLRFAVVASP
jgi:biopolymer transport protein ExbD